MSRTIGLIIAIVVVLGLGFYVYSRKKAGKPLFGQPPLYSGYGPGPQNPGGPPVGKASLTSTLQNITNVVNGGDKLLMAGKNAWDDVSGLFGNSTDNSYSSDYVDSLPGSS